MTKINWQLKADASPQGGSDGFWYGITDGGYIKPEEMLADKFQLKALLDAIAVVQSFQSALEDANLINEF